MSTLRAVGFFCAKLWEKPTDRSVTDVEQQQFFVWMKKNQNSVTSIYKIYSKLKAILSEGEDGMPIWHWRPHESCQNDENFTLVWKLTESIGVKMKCWIAESDVLFRDAGVQSNNPQRVYRRYT